MRFLYLLVVAVAGYGFFYGFYAVDKDLNHKTETASVPKIQKAVKSAPDLKGEGLNPHRAIAMPSTAPGNWKPMWKSPLQIGTMEGHSLLNQGQRGETKKTELPKFQIVPQAYKNLIAIYRSESSQPHGELGSATEEKMKWTLAASRRIQFANYVRIATMQTNLGEAGNEYSAYKNLYPDRDDVESPFVASLSEDFTKAVGRSLASYLKKENALPVPFQDK